MTDATGHLPYWTLEQLAENDLSHAETSLAEQHLRRCAHCAAELASVRALVAALEGLPSFVPSLSFADAVMARVQVAPEAAPAAERVGVRRWLPQAQRGWMMLLAFVLAPVAPVWLLGGWLAAHPLVSVGALWAAARGWALDVAWAGVVDAAGALARSGAFTWLAGTAGSLPGPRAAGLPLALLLAMALVPVAAVTIVRILKTPAPGMTHA